MPVPLSWLTSASLARLGDEMAAPALLLGAAGTGASAAQAASAVSALTLGCALAGPGVGLALDRHAAPARLIAGAMTWVALMLAIIALTTPPPTWVLLAAAFAAGCGTPAVLGGWTAQLPALVPAQRLDKAAAMDAATYNVAGIVGPLVVAVVVAVASPGWAVPASAAVLFVAVPIALRTARMTPLLAHPAGLVRPDRDAATGALAGLRALVVLPRLRTVTVLTTMGHLGMGMAFVATPLLAVGHGASPGSAGVLLGSLSAGALLGVVGMPRLSRRASSETVVIVGTGLIGALFLAASASPAWLILHGVFVLIGVAEGMVFTSMLAVRHREAPQGARSNVHTTAASLKLGAFAVGAASGAFLSSGPSLILAAGVTHLVALAAVVTPRLARCGRRSVSAG